jgi:serine/threonine-protein kinase
MNAQSLNACWNAIPPEKREAPEHLDRRLARQAVHAKVLTLWQAQQLLAGRTTGFKVDRYVLMDLIGQGGMGRVYLAIDSRLNRRVALKILSPERVNNPRAISRFQREARVGAQLQHENLVRIYDFGESSGRYYLVMEYIEGKTIGTLITEGGPMPPATAVHLVRQVALGLEHAHRKGLIHRDVNPYNILITHDGIAKLADMGLAIDLAEEDRVTREGATVGTFDYVAPEQARHSHSADIRSDIYSLGCTLYHMLSGQVPFPTPSLPEKLFAHQAMEATPLHKLISGLSEGLAEIVSRMMRKSPDERYATPILVVQALAPFEVESKCLEAGTEITGPARQPVLEPSSQPPLLGDEVTQFAPESPAAGSQGSATPASLQGAGGGQPHAGLSPSPNMAGASTAVSTLTPVNDAAVSDPDFPLLVDLGPEPSLSEGLSRPRARLGQVLSTTTGSSATPQTPVSSTETSTDQATLPSLWQRPLTLSLAAVRLRVWLVVAVVLTLSLLSLALLGIPGTGPESGAIPRQPDLTIESSKKSASSTARPINSSIGSPTQESPFIVQLADEKIPFQHLRSAIEMAMAHHGYVELNNREPYRLREDQPLDFQQGVGKLVIRAAPGVAPVVECELKGPKALITTGSGVPVDISGITVVVHYSQSDTSRPPAVLKCARTATLDRCAFKVAGGSHRKGSRAIVCQGDRLEINRCWFEGFDEAIEVSLVNSGSCARVRQTMIVPSTPRSASDGLSSEWHGWGVQLIPEKRPKTAQSQLVLEHCTIEGAGVLDLSASPSSAPVRVEVRRCAVKAEALLACKADNPAEPLSTRVLWSGSGNQYDILGRDWIVLSAQQGTPAFSIAVNDLGSWSKVTDERGSISAKLAYGVDPAARSNSVKPSDFAISHSGSLEDQAGANPDLVGPSTNPEPSSR